MGGRLAHTEDLPEKLLADSCRHCHGFLKGSSCPDNMVSLNTMVTIQGACINRPAIRLTRVWDAGGDS